MNRIHRTVWNPSRGVYMVAAETTRRQGKASGASGALLAGVLMGAVGVARAAGPAAAALPTGAQITAGQAQIATAGKTMTVTQGSDKAAINWGSFSIGKDATVQFVQPNASAVALNRVIGTESSVIEGALSANGQVFILNPNGVLFGKNARVDTAGLVATTLRLSDANFLAGKTGFAGHGGAVVNQGSLTAKDGGYIALIGQQVKNDGTITARLGTVALAAGDKVSLNFNGDSLVGVAIDRGALDALVANGGAIRADGGLVVLTAKGAEGLVNTLVNNTGEIRAQTVENRAGRIYLLGEGGKVEVAGTLDASAPRAGDGGFVETSGSKVHVSDSGKVTTLARQGASGNWLIDPTDFTVAESGGDITGAALSSNLAAGSVTIQSTSGAHGLNGDVVVNDPVIWGANTTLTLEAQNNIYVFSNITATGASGKLALYYGQGALASGNTSTYTVSGAQVNLQAGQNFDTKQGSDGAVTNWTVITALGAAGSLTGTDLQGINGNPSGNFALGADIAAGDTNLWNAGAGFDPLSFSGNFDGLGHKIDGLFINKSSGYAGLFASLSGTARNVGVTNANVTGGGYYTGALAGYSSGLVEASYSTGSVTGDNSTGGLVGYNDGTIRTSFSGAHVTGGSNVGGLLGNNWGYVLDTYATGTVYGLESVGGLIGQGYYSQEVSRSYAVGAVTADVNALYVGGLVAPSNQPIPGTANFWDVATTGQVASGTGTGLTTAQMTTTGTFTGAGWNFTLGSGVWARRDDLNNMYPVLRTFGYTDRIGVASVPSSYFADPTAALSYTTSGLLSGDTITLTQSGSTLNYIFNNPGRAGLYDALMVRSQAPTGNLTVNRPIAWNDFQLTLEAAGDINVNAVMTASGTATLDLKTGYNFNAAYPTFNAANTVNMAMDANGVFTGRVDIDRAGTGILTINNAGYTLIDSVGAEGDELGGSAQTLQGMARQENLAGNYALASNIDASGTATWNSGAGFTPIGTNLYMSGGSPVPFSGAFDGLGHSISGLTETLGSGSTVAGLFGYVGNSALRNVALLAAQINGYQDVGALLGEALGAAQIANAFSSGAISNDPSQDSVGGLVGFATSPGRGEGSMRNVHSTAAVTGGSNGNVGGLVGYSSGFDITDASATGPVTSTGSGVAGLVGDFEVGTLTRVVATGAVSAHSYVGGLVGYLYDATLVHGIYSGVGVTGTGNTVGGLIGFADGYANPISISDGQSSGTVAGAGNVGGLVGYSSTAAIITNSSSSANVSGASGADHMGGAVGYADTLTITNTHVTGTVNGYSDVGGLVGSMSAGSIGTSSSSGNVSADHRYVGGLIGEASNIAITGSWASGAVLNDDGDFGGGMVGLLSNSSITNSYATGAVVGNGSRDFMGGLVGYATNVVFQGTYATGNVTSGGNSIGGLIGHSEYNTIGVSYASGNVSGNNRVGGLVGEDDSALSSTTDAYARGNVTGADQVGGLFGYTINDTIANVYSTGLVTGTSNVGGLIGSNGGSVISNSFWDVQTSGIGTAGSTTGSAGGTGRSTADMTTTSTFTTAGWDFTFGTGIWGRKDTVNDKYPVLRAFGYTDPLTLTLADAGKVYGDANPVLGSLVVTGACAPNCANYLTGATWGSAIGATNGVGNYAYSAANVLGFTFASGYTASMFDITLPTGGLTITPRPVSLATLAGATRVYDRTTDAASALFALGNLVNGDSVSLSGTATLGSANAGTQTVGNVGMLTLSNPNYTLVGVTPNGTVTVTPRAVGVATVGGATRVYDATTDAAAGLFQTTGVLSGDTVNLAGTGTLASKNVGAQTVGLGTLALDNANYTLIGVAPTGTVAILPRTLNLSFTVADKTFDGSTAASATASDNRISGDQFTAQFGAAFADTNAGTAKPVAITGLALQGADAGNYQLASTAGSGVTGNMLTRSVTYTLAAQDPAKTYTANGQVLVSASALDQLVVASFANTVAGTSPGALSYTIFKNGQQVDAITDAGAYEIRASFAAADPHYALASTGNAALTIVVAAATAVTPPPATGTTPSASAEAGPVAEVIAQAVRTEVPVSTAAVLANAGVGAPRSLVDFSAMPPNVATSPAALTAAFGEGVPLSLLSSPSGEEPSEGVTLEQAKRMVATPAGGAESPTHDVRVPVSRNSLAQIVNGGVKLPGGVDQLLFVVKADK